jgi:hypothetical protein
MTCADPIFLEEHSEYISLLSNPKVPLPSTPAVKDAYLAAWSDITQRSALRGAIQRVEILEGQIAELDSVRNNWDGYGAAAPNDYAIAQSRLALRLASVRQPLPNSIVPAGEGGVAICWDVDLRHAYIEIGNDETAIVATYTGLEDPYVHEFSPTGASIEDAIGIIREFFH